MKDPAWGRSKSERALGEHMTGNKKKDLKAKRSTVDDIRIAHVGQFDGVKPSYGRYLVSEQSKDILNRSNRNI